MRSLLVLLAVLLALPAAAQDFLTRGREALARASYQYDADSLLTARGLLYLAATADGPEADWATYYAALADYRLANVFWASDPERADEHALQGTNAIAEFRREESDDPVLNAEAAALHAALLASLMGLDSSRGMTLGGLSQQTIGKAVRLAPDNPRVQYVQATALLNTPPEWGGDRARATEILAEAVETFDAGSDPASAYAPTWGHADALAWLGMAHLMANDAAAARPMIERAEALDPNSEFVRYKLKGWLAQVESQAAAN